MPDEEKPLPAVYFEATKGGGAYWLTMPDNELVRLGQSDLKLWMKKHKVGMDGSRDELSDFERLLLKWQHKNRVDYAGPLAGHRIGQQMIGGNRVLVTKESGVYKAPTKAGKTPFWREFLKALLVDRRQIDAVLDWWSCGLRRLVAGEFGPGQAMVMTGPPGCGKSLFQHLTTEIFGGRKADPFRYMSGLTSFNADLAEAEHLMIEDKSASTDIRSRREFGARLKELVVNRDMSVHPKGGQALTLPTFRRVTVTVNDEVENLSILPPLDESILDKLTILRAQNATGALKATEPATWKAFMAELPAIRHELMRRDIPKERRCPRFGVKAYHDASILEAAGTLEPQNRLLALLDEEFSEELREGPVSLSAEELEKRLRRGEWSYAAERLLSFSSACGTYLGRLASQKPDRVTKTVSKGRTTWHLHLASE